jgi:hypothetical protein
MTHENITNESVRSWINEVKGRKIELCMALSIYSYQLDRLLSKPLTSQNCVRFANAIEVIENHEHGLGNPYEAIMQWASKRRGRMVKLSKVSGIHNATLHKYGYEYMPNAVYHKLLNATKEIEKSEAEIITNKEIIEWANLRHGRRTKLARVMGTSSSNECFMLSKERTISKDNYELYKIAMEEVMQNEPELVYETPEMHEALHSKKITAQDLAIAIGKPKNYLTFVSQGKKLMTKEDYSKVLKVLSNLPN